ncbi:hypothetical protein [Parasphingorhabdus sp.]|uniref:hypothetical protein n=1 Tax=Parasphingorhabdus sp. TaxID=2709688 RepID=UPI003298F039
MCRAFREFHALPHAAASGWIVGKIDLKRLQVWVGHARQSRLVRLKTGQSAI